MRVVVVLVVVVVAVVAVVGVVLVVGVTVLVAVVRLVGGFALVLDEREVVADAVALAVVRLAALAEDVGVAVTEAGLLEPQAAISVASAMPSPSAVEVGRIFIGRV